MICKTSQLETAPHAYTCIMWFSWNLILKEVHSTINHSSQTSTEKKNIFWNVKIQVMYFYTSLLLINYKSLDTEIVECIDECIDCRYIDNGLILSVWTPAVLSGTRWDHAWNTTSTLSVYSGACAVRDRSRNWEWQKVL